MSFSRCVPHGASPEKIAESGNRTPAIESLASAGDQL
jgi:hypothetical protein